MGEDVRSYLGLFSYSFTVPHQCDTSLFMLRFIRAALLALVLAIWNPVLIVPDPTVARMSTLMCVVDVFDADLYHNSPFIVLDTSITTEDSSHL